MGRRRIGCHHFHAEAGWFRERSVRRPPMKKTLRIFNDELDCDDRRADVVYLAAEG
jgi:hypothetical protein